MDIKLLITPTNCWKCLKLNKPNNEFIKYSIKESNSINLPEIYSTLNEGAILLSEENPLFQEAKLIRLMKYKNSHKLPRDQAYSYFMMVSQNLNKISRFNIQTSFANLKKIIYNCLHTSGDVMVPTRQEFVSLLVQIQSTVALYSQLSQKCLHFYSHVLPRLELGHLLESFIPSTSIVSRIKYLSDRIIVYLFEIYDKLRVYSERLKDGSSKWVIDWHQMPSNLSEWLTSTLGPEFNPLSNKSESSDKLSTPNSLNKTSFNNHIPRKEDNLVINSDIGYPVKRTEQNFGSSVDIGYPVSRTEHKLRSNGDLGKSIKKNKESELKNAIKKKLIKKKIPPKTTQKIKDPKLIEIEEKINSIEKSRDFLNICKDLHSKDNDLLNIKQKKNLKELFKKLIEFGKSKSNVVKKSVLKTYQKQLLDILHN